MKHCFLDMSHVCSHVMCVFVCVSLLRSCIMKTDIITNNVSAVHTVDVHWPMSPSPVRTMLSCVMTVTAASFPQNVWPAAKP